MKKSILIMIAASIVLLTGCGEKKSDASAYQVFYSNEEKNALVSAELQIKRVYDGTGHLLLTRRAKGKSFAGTWENSGGAVKAGETSRQAVARELFEETGIRANPEEFEYLDTDCDRNMFYDHYCLRRRVSLKDIVLLPGETDGVMWASFGKVHWMIRTGKICKIIGSQFRRQEKALRLRNLSNFKR